MRRAALGLVWISMAAALAGFMLPWVRLDVRAESRSTASGNKLVDLQHVTLQIHQGERMLEARWPSPGDFPRTIRGIEIPGLARQDEAQIAVSLVELLTGDPHRLRLKGHLVILVPLLVMLGGLIALWQSARPVATGTIALLAAAAAVYGILELRTVQGGSSMLVVTVEPGMWLSLGAYVGLTVGASGLATGRRSER